MGHRRLRLVTAMVLALATTACGARLSPQQVAAVGPKAARGANPSVTGAGLAAATTTTVAGANGGGSTAGASTSGGSTAGAATGPGADQAQGGDTCTPTGGATDVGVTDTSVTAGSVAVVSGPVPGLFKNVQQGVKAYFNYINSQGGVCGRKLNIELADDRLDTGTNRSQTENMKDHVFAFVGGYSVVDDGGASVLAGSGIPDIGSSIGAQRGAMAENFSTNPTNPTVNTNGAAPQIKYFMDHYGVSRGAVIWPAQADARRRGQAYLTDMATAGLPAVDTFEVAVTETNYAGVITKMQQDGIDFFITVLEVNGISRIFQAMDQVGYHPKVSFPGQQAYGSQFLALAGSSANGAILALGHAIVEDKDANPEMAHLVEWYNRTNPGSDIDFFAIQGWVAGSMFVDALKMAGPQPTRAKVLEALGTFHAFDAHGLIAPMDPAGKNPTSCFQVVTVADQHWQRIDPASGFICP